MPGGVGGAVRECLAPLSRLQPFASAARSEYLWGVNPGTENPHRGWVDDSDARRGPQRLVQAARSSRLLASFIDGVLALGVLLPIQFALGAQPRLDAQVPLTPLQSVLWSATGLAVFVAMHGYLLKKNGQTIGKRLLRIRIASSEDGSTPPLDRLLLWRVLPVQVVVLLPFVGMLAVLADALFIFRRDYRCLHDHLARTIVVQAPAE